MNVQRPRQVAEKSIKVLSKEQAVIPSDIGILEGTFVTPTGRNAPSFFQSPRAFLKLQWVRTRLHIRDYISLLIIKVSSPRGKSWWQRPQVKIHRSQTAPAAIALHREMYSAFADGDKRALRKICTDGLYDSFSARIGSRAKGERVVWELVTYNKRAKVVSNRAARLPIDGAAIRQAVVRICSTQKLTRYTPKGDIVNGTGKEKSVVEYVLIQKKIWDWQDGGWQVWGTTEETTLDDVLEWEKKALEN